MPSSKRTGPCIAVGLLLVLGFPALATAQTPAQGFGVERFYPSAPGAGWFVLDTLDMHGRLGGVMSFTTGYAHDSLRLRSDNQSLAVVSTQAFAGFGFAATYDRFRVYLNFQMPLATRGTSGEFAGYSFTAPRVDPGSVPDAFSDLRLGASARLFGAADAPIRLGLSGELYFPSGAREDYETDRTYRAMGRLLGAGDVGHFTYAGALGVHLRPLSEPSPEGPDGNELLFSVAAGGKLAADAKGQRVIIIGPEFFGASAFHSLLSSSRTAFEALLTTRIEDTAESGTCLRVKLGFGAGLNPHFGAPEERALISVEVFDRQAN